MLIAVKVMLLNVETREGLKLLDRAVKVKEFLKIWKREYIPMRYIHY